MNDGQWNNGLSSSFQFVHYSDAWFLFPTGQVICCELTLSHHVTKEGALILMVKHSSWVRICASEYRQLVMTCTYANLS